MKSTHVSPADEMPVYAPDSHTNHQSELYIYPNAEKELATGEEDHSVMPWTPPAFSNFETVQPVGGTEGGGGGGGGRNKKRSSGIERKARAEGSEDSAGLVGSSGTGVARSKSGKRVIQFSEKEGESWVISHPVEGESSADCLQTLSRRSYPLIESAAGSA